MSSKGSNGVMPKLRFSEFMQSKAWDLRSLGELFTDRQETGYNDLPLLSLTDKEGIIPQAASNRRDNSNLDKTKYLRVCPGDIAYNTMRMWEGRSALSALEGLVSPAYTVCKPTSQVHSPFFAYYFKTIQLISQFHRYSQGLVKDTLNLKYPAFSGIPVWVPSLPEQQKIADCLTSLDAVITAEAQKLDALKAHKKGLMQQLFPAEGETVPKRRFPEFEKHFWREVRLAEVTSECTTRNNNHLLKHRSVMGVSKAEGIVPMEERIVGANISRYKIVRTNCFAYNPMRLNIGSIALWRGKDDILVSPDYVVFECTDNSELGILPEFLDHFRRSPQWTEFMADSGLGGVRIRIYYKDIALLTLRLPSHAEQRKIADCLTSLDELIAAQAEKIEALKAQKKGLLQGLFPLSGL